MTGIEWYRCGADLDSSASKWLRVTFDQMSTGSGKSPVRKQRKSTDWRGCLNEFLQRRALRELLMESRVS